MSHQLGYYQLDKPRIQVPRGLDLNLPTSLRKTVAIKADEGLLSGMVCHLAWNAGAGAYEAAKGCIAGSTPYFAFQSQIDFDVIESGMITLLSSSGDFDIVTPFFKAGDTYNEDTFITYDAVSGDVKAAIAGDVILGKISGGLRGPVQLNPLDPAATGGSRIFQVSDSSAVAPVKVVQITTNYNGAEVPA